MAKLIEGFEFTGRLGNLTAYRMKGCDRIILRRVGGPTAQQFKKAPQFSTARLHSKEFGVRAKATSIFTRMVRPHKPVSDGNNSYAVGANLRVLQEFDTVHTLGQRSILFSQYPRFWEGFSLNSKRSFDAIVYAPLQCTISRETMTAQVEIPELIPKVHLALPDTRSLFRIQASLGLLPDFVYHQASKQYIPAIEKERIAPVTATTPWLPGLSKAPMPATTLTLTLPPVPVTEGFALMVSVGICFGAPVSLPDQVVQLENAGAAKVLAVR